MTTTAPGRDKAWIFRTYAGHSTAVGVRTSFTGTISPRARPACPSLSTCRRRRATIPIIPLSRGEVGKVGVPISHLGDMKALFDGIPIAKMNTSMTINATAPWLLSLYIAAADAQGAPRAVLQGTTQNDIIKEYLSRGTYVFPPGPSLRLTKDVILFTTKEVPKWNPMNVCSYHLQEAGATPVQELSYALATAVAILDMVKNSGEVSDADFGEVVGRISFFLNAGMRFVTELAKVRAFTELWDELTRDRYGVKEEKFRRFRYGVQVNSLGLTEQQPENNVYRILIETLAVVLSKKARARAVQLPAWNEALGLPRPFDQQWSLRLQQILAYETDLLEYGDLFDGAVELAKKVDALKNEALARACRDRRHGRRGRSGRNRLSQVQARRIQHPTAGDDRSRASRSSSASTNSSRPSLRRSPRATARSWSCRTRSKPSRSSGSRRGGRNAMALRSPRRSPICARRRRKAVISWSRRSPPPRRA